MGHSFTELLARIIVPALQTTLYMVAIATICSADLVLPYFCILQENLVCIRMRACSQ